MASGMRKRSEIVERYIEAAGVRDSATLIEMDWLDRAVVHCCKMHTDVATMRITAWWVSMFRQPVDEVKAHVSSFMLLKYKVASVEFFQSPEERKATTPLRVYFHCICEIEVK